MSSEQGNAPGPGAAGFNRRRSLAVTEALFGQIYLVTVVALIVANLGRSRPAAGA